MGGRQRDWRHRAPDRGPRLSAGGAGGRGPRRGAEAHRSRAVVVRDGAEREVFAVDVEPGDIVVLEAGSRVPADGRVLFAEDLRVNESTLTGESFPVRKVVAPLPADTPLAERRAMVSWGPVWRRAAGAHSSRPPGWRRRWVTSPC